MPELYFFSTVVPGEDDSTCPSSAGLSPLHEPPFPAGASRSRATGRPLADFHRQDFAALRFEALAVFRSRHPLLSRQRQSGFLLFSSSACLAWLAGAIYSGSFCEMPRDECHERDYCVAGGLTSTNSTD